MDAGVLRACRALVGYLGPVLRPPPMSHRGPLSRLVPRGSRMFDGIGLRCRWCMRKGHLLHFCPAVPRPSPGFLGRLLGMPRVDRSTFCGLSLEEVKARIEVDGARMNGGNPWLGLTGRPFDLRKNLGYWRAIGANNSVLSVIGNGAPMPFHHAPARVALRNHASCEEHAAYVDEQMRDHLRDGTFIEVEAAFPEVVNPLTVAVNDKGKKRMCLDLRYPNAFTPVVNFKLDTLETGGHEVVFRDCALLFVDIEKAYYSLGMASDVWPYACWQWRGSFFCTVVVPFGATLAPFHFHKCIRELVKLLRGLGMRVHNYLDDFMIACHRDDVQSVAPFLQWFLVRMGFRMSVKSIWDGRTVGVHLGMAVNSAAYTYSVPQAKLDKALMLVRAFDSEWRRTGALAGMANVVGLLASFKIGFVGVRPFTRAMYRAAGAALTGTPLASVDAARLADELQYWLAALRDPSKNGLPIREPASEVTVNFDASDTGWGAVMRRTGAAEVRVSGVFDSMVLGSSSTLRELTGVVLGGAALLEHVRGRNLLARLDSFPAVCNLINGGGGVPELADVVKRWVTWCGENRVRVQVEWVPRERNEDADALSKLFVGEWQLLPDAREWLDVAFGPFVLHPFEDGVVLCTPAGRMVGECLAWAAKLRLTIVLVHPWPLLGSWLETIKRYARAVFARDLGLAGSLFVPSAKPPSDAWSRA